jgi:hypothetical protein
VSKQLVKDNLWRGRIDGANRYYDQWETLFKCKILEQYYEGQQWKGQQNLGYNPYVINKTYETIDIKIAEFVPTFPSFLVSSQPSAEEYNLETASQSANLKQDVLNSLIQNDNGHFSDEFEMAYKDHFFRFGIIEVGYAADWIINPAAPKPLLAKDVDKNVNGKDRSKIKFEPPELPVNERIYFKHISAKRFRIGGFDHKYLQRCGWCGYYEYIHKDDLLSLKILNRDKVEYAQGVPPSAERDTGDVEDQRYRTSEYLKVWHIWENRGLNRLIVLDSPTVTIFQRPYKRLNLFDFRRDKRVKTEGFYPIPPVFHWISPQDEINETREMLRTHRRRFIRKFQVVTGGVDEPELEKFETGPDGALIKVNRENAIAPIQNADLGPEIGEAIQTSAADFNEISGTSNQDRQVSDRGTATEATYINQRGEMRANKERDVIVKWLASIGREALLLAHEKFTLGIWTKLTSPEGEEFLGQVNPKQNALQWVSSEKLNDGYDFKIEVDVTSVSVAAQQDEKKKFFEFLAGMNQFPQIAFSPLMVRELAVRVGYRNERVIKEAQKMALTMEIGRQMQMQTQLTQMEGQMAPPPGGNAAQQISARATPPGADVANNQLVPQNGSGVIQ